MIVVKKYIIPHLIVIVLALVALWLGHMSGGYFLVGQIVGLIAIVFMGIEGWRKRKLFRTVDEVRPILLWVAAFALVIAFIAWVIFGVKARPYLSIGCYLLIFWHIHFMSPRCPYYSFLFFVWHFMLKGYGENFLG